MENETYVLKAELPFRDVPSFTDPAAAYSDLKVRLPDQMWHVIFACDHAYKDWHSCLAGRKVNASVYYPGKYWTTTSTL